MSSPEILIRELSETHLRAACTLLSQLGYDADEERLRSRIDAVATSPRSQALIATDSAGEPVALASLHLLSLLTEDTPVAMITSLVVAERARGRGIGRAMVDELCRRARAAGSRRLILTTHLRRSEAHAFYERLGFEFTGRRYVRTLTPTEGEC